VRATIKMPKLGDTAREVVVLEWTAKVGDAIVEGAPLMTVQTDKVDVEVPSPVAGTIVEELVSPDDEVAVGAPIAIVEV
jgi:pyruvate/2-oxoglutarate dehydrogenase complex dihydrolipoamide acyltransferase (E2) component